MIIQSDLTEVRPHEFVTEASDLGWPAGHWPKRVDVNVGNGQPFQMYHADETGARYRQLGGCCTLRVFND